MYNIGNGAMWLGDCLELMKYIPDGSIDMVLCDLPYGTTACAWDSIIPFEPLWLQYWRVAKPNAAIVLTGSQPFTSALIGSQIKRFKVEWIWKKNNGSNFGTTKWFPMKEHESVCVFAKGTPVYNPIMQERSENGKKMVRNNVTTKAKEKPSGFVENGGLNNGHQKLHLDPELRVPSSVQFFNVERGLHPTQKPVALFEYLIKTYTNPGDLVLDNCSGSGTTAVAAQQSGRRFICIEKEPAYYYGSCGRIWKALQ